MFLILWNEKCKFLPKSKTIKRCSCENLHYPPAFKGNSQAHFYHCGRVFSFLELHVNRIMSWVVFYIRKQFLRSIHVIGPTQMGPMTLIWVLISKCQLDQYRLPYTPRGKMVFRFYSVSCPSAQPPTTLNGTLNCPFASPSHCILLPPTPNISPALQGPLVFQLSSEQPPRLQLHTLGSLSLHFTHVWHHSLGCKLIESRDWDQLCVSRTSCIDVDTLYCVSSKIRSDINR